MTALGDGGGGEHLFTFAWAGEESYRVGEEGSLVGGNRDNYRSGGFLTVLFLGFQVPSGGDDSAICKANGVLHGLIQLRLVVWQDMNRDVVDGVVGGGGGQIENVVRNFFDREGGVQSVCEHGKVARVG